MKPEFVEVQGTWEQASPDATVVQDVLGASLVHAVDAQVGIPYGAVILEFHVSRPDGSGVRRVDLLVPAVLADELLDVLQVATTHWSTETPTEALWRHGA